MIRTNLRFFVGGFFLLLLFVSSSCREKEPRRGSKVENFDMLWRILDEHYCYFDLKLKDRSWRDVYEEYRPKVSEEISQDSLFNVMVDMLSQLRDGHVNLVSPFDYGRYWHWRDDYNANYDASVVSKYLGNSYKIAGGIYYTTVQLEDGLQDEQVGYLRVPSFQSGISHSNIVAVLLRLAHCRGLIIDIRNNGGGSLATSDRLVSYLMSEELMQGRRKIQVATISHKTGPGHQAFSEPQPLYLDYKEAPIHWQRSDLVVILTNRGVYSAANDFAMKAKVLGCTLLGDYTGGGGGLPMSSELPNGWTVRYSSSITRDLEGQDVEFGIAPTLLRELDEAELLKGRDSYIDEAVRLILQRSNDGK